MSFPDIDPVAFYIGSFGIYWYSIAYIAGILLGYYYAKNINRKLIEQLNDKQLESLLSWMVIGVIIGGRLGHVVIYKLDYFFNNPIEILAIREGGMSFHGGFLGVICACFFFTKKYKIHFLTLTDIIAVVSPIGFFFGRIANFINGELFGTVTNLPWGVIFPGGGSLPRHPSQLYEALGEGVVLFFIMFFSSRKKINPIGKLSGIFCISYGLARLIIEHFREFDSVINKTFYSLTYLTLGQGLTIPIIVLGIFLYIISKKHA